MGADRAFSALTVATLHARGSSTTILLLHPANPTRTGKGVVRVGWVGRNKTSLEWGGSASSLEWGGGASSSNAHAGSYPH